MLARQINFPEDHTFNPVNICHDYFLGAIVRRKWCWWWLRDEMYFYFRHQNEPRNYTGGNVCLFECVYCFSSCWKKAVITLLAKNPPRLNFTSQLPTFSPSWLNAFVILSFHHPSRHDNIINIKHFLSSGCIVQFSIQRAAFSNHSWRCMLLPSLADQWILIVSSITNFTQDKCNFYRHSNVNVGLKLVIVSICYLFLCVQIFFRQLQIKFS